MTFAQALTGIIIAGVYTLWCVFQFCSYWETPRRAVNYLIGMIAGIFALGIITGLALAS